VTSDTGLGDLRHDQSPENWHRQYGNAEKQGELHSSTLELLSVFVLATMTGAILVLGRNVAVWILLGLRRSSRTGFHIHDWVQSLGAGD
jgi:hypothetical protein